MSWYSQQLNVGIEEINVRYKICWQTDCSRLKEKVANQGEFLWVGTSRFYNPFSSKWKPCHRAINNWHIKSEWCWKSTLDFTQIVNNNALKWQILCHSLKFVSHFSQKLHITFWKNFHSVLLCTVGSDSMKEVGC